MSTSVSQLIEPAFLAFASVPDNLRIYKDLGMAAYTFDHALDLLDISEGGNSDDKRDPGGWTSALANSFGKKIEMPLHPTRS